MGEKIKELISKIHLKDILKKIADVLNEHWIWKTIILFIPSIYMPIVIKYIGIDWGMTKADGSFTTIGWTTTGIIYGAVLFINILSCYKAKRDKEDEASQTELLKNMESKYKEEIATYKTNLGIYGKLLQVIGNICDTKFDSILSYIDESISKGRFTKPFNETTYPEKQLKKIAQEIKLCISEITEAPFNNITVSMAVEFPDINKQIKWIDQSETMQCMKLEKLKKNNKTAFFQVYSGQSEYEFHNDKFKANKENKYVFDNKDQRFDNIGSIICEEVRIEEDDLTLARLILSISTYGYKFTDNDNEEHLNRISTLVKEVILQQFDKRIKIELALLYIKKKYNANKNKKTSTI